MQIDRNFLEQLIFNGFHEKLRFTQDSPVYPDVWLEYYHNIKKLPTYRADLILTPHRQSSAAELFVQLNERLNTDGIAQHNKWRMASNGETVVASLTFKELITVALPITNWWQNYLWKNNKATADHNWLMELLGAFFYLRNTTSRKTHLTQESLLKSFRTLALKNYPDIKDQPRENGIYLWSVSRNRPATITIEKSVPMTKGDAGRRVFDIDGTEICWAVLDTGIDARHSAFRKKDPTTKKYYPEPMGAPNDKASNKTRIIATYDFTNFRDILSHIHSSDSTVAKQAVGITSDKEDKKLNDSDLSAYVRDTEKGLKSGRVLDWSILSPLLRIPHNDQEYVPPTNPHGTHVAGILGAGLSDPAAPKQINGMCPGIGLYDIRVLNGKGESNEFNVLAAIQFIRWMNNQKDGIIIHGVNLSMSMIHDVFTYACGQTPVCDACTRLVAEGTVVVAAAGNLGQTYFQDQSGSLMQGFRMVNITDPGNAEDVITVGSTHKDRPHSYGISYFSSKGPTGDGRIKPDIVAPGEKIISTVIDNATDRMDGTSMAAPHVSGAAALLMAKHKELIGRPKKIKDILCKTATDLGREKYFQGCGMVDVLRAIQSV